MRSRCQTLGLLDLRRSGCYAKEIPLHLEGFDPCGFGNCDFWLASRHMGNTTVSIVNSSEIVNNADM